MNHVTERDRQREREHRTHTQAMVQTDRERDRYWEWENEIHNHIFLYEFDVFVVWCCCTRSFFVLLCCVVILCSAVCFYQKIRAPVNEQRCCREWWWWKWQKQQQQHHRPRKIIIKKVNLFCLIATHFLGNPFHSREPRTLVFFTSDCNAKTVFYVVGYIKRNWYIIFRTKIHFNTHLFTSMGGFLLFSLFLSLSLSHSLHACARAYVCMCISTVDLKGHVTGGSKLLIKLLMDLTLQRDFDIVVSKLCLARLKFVHPIGCGNSIPTSSHTKWTDHVDCYFISCQLTV